MSEDKIEITPEMIAAGISAYYASDELLETTRDIVVSIYTAMALAAPSQENGHE